MCKQFPLGFLYREKAKTNVFLVPFSERWPELLLQFSMQNEWQTMVTFSTIMTENQNTALNSIAERQRYPLSMVHKQSSVPELYTACYPSVYQAQHPHLNLSSFQLQLAHNLVMMYWIHVWSDITPTAQDVTHQKHSQMIQHQRVLFRLNTDNIMFSDVVLLMSGMWTGGNRRVTEIVTSSCLRSAVWLHASGKCQHGRVVVLASIRGVKLSSEFRSISGLTHSL